MNVRWSASNLTTPGGQTVTAIPAALALVGLVFGVVIAFQLRPEEAAFTYGIAASAGTFVVFGALTALVASRTRARVALGWDGDALRLDVTMPGAPTVSYTGPFEEAHGYRWDHVHTGRGAVRQLMVELVISETRTQRRVLHLRELLGAIYEPPAGWSEVGVPAGRSEHVLTNSIGRIQLDALARELRRGG